MPEYRAYIVGTDGAFKKAIEIDCADDDAAKQRAKALVDGHDVELWQSARLVQRFKHVE